MKAFLELASQIKRQKEIRVCKNLPLSHMFIVIVSSFLCGQFSCYIIKENKTYGKSLVLTYLCIMRMEKVNLDLSIKPCNWRMFSVAGYYIPIHRYFPEFLYKLGGKFLRLKRGFRLQSIIYHCFRRISIVSAVCLITSSMPSKTRRQKSTYTRIIVKKWNI